MVRMAMTPAAAAFSKRKPNKSRSVSLKMILVFVAGYVLGNWHGRSLPDELTVSSSNLLSTSTTSTQASAFSSIVSQKEDGWNSITVFYGSTDYVVSLLPKDQIWFSQARQEEAILRLLSSKGSSASAAENKYKGGFFVDLAANDATLFSNTYILERDYNWKGLCIEPNPLYWYNLTHYRPNCQLVGAVVGAQRMEKIDFLFSAGDHGGIVGDKFDNRNKKRKTHVEYTVTLLEILERHNTPKVIDYLSLDVEGAEEFIMQNFPLANYKIRAMTIERPKDGLRKILEQHGYQQVMRLSRWGETLWAHQEFLKDFDTDPMQEFDAKVQREKAKALFQAQQQKGQSEGK
jgi:hypothetical protein